jgi:hypothetical protein
MTCCFGRARLLPNRFGPKARQEPCPTRSDNINWPVYQTDNGELIISTGNPNVKVIVRKGGKDATILDLPSGGAAKSLIWVHE